MQQPDGLCHYRFVIKDTCVLRHILLYIKLLLYIIKLFSLNVYDLHFVLGFSLINFVVFKVSLQMFLIKKAVTLNLKHLFEALQDG